MIGGVVIERILLPGKVWVSVVDAAEERNDRCAIYVQRTEDSIFIEPGDTLWWQGAFAMWTPHRARGDKRVDVKIPRIGYSGVKRPEVSK